MERCPGEYPLGAQPDISSGVVLTEHASQPEERLTMLHDATLAGLRKWLSERERRKVAGWAKAKTCLLR